MLQSGHPAEWQSVRQFPSVSALRTAVPIHCRPAPRHMSHGFYWHISFVPLIHGASSHILPDSRFPELPVQAASLSAELLHPSERYINRKAVFLRSCSLAAASSGAAVPDPLQSPELAYLHRPAAQSSHHSDRRHRLYPVHRFLW